jgi:hypothetical protein
MSAAMTASPGAVEEEEVCKAREEMFETYYRKQTVRQFA